MSNKKLVLCCALLLSASAWSTTVSSSMKAIMEKAPHNSANLTFPTVKETEVVENLKFSSSKRRPANSFSVDTSKMKKLQELTKELHALNTPEEVQAYLEKLDANYDSYPNDVKFYVATIMPMQAFRGSFFRLRSLFEKQSRFIHSQVLTFAKGLATRSNVFLPVDHVKAVYDYVASPYFVGEKLVSGFQEESDLQVWQVNELLPQLIKSIQRLEALNLKEAIVWDQRIAFGPESFQDDIGRYKQIGEFERQLAVASLYSSVGALCISRAYSVDNSISLGKEIGSLYGFDGFGFNSVNGVSAKKVAHVMKKKQFKNTGVLMPDGASWMQTAYESSQKSVSRIKMAWNNSANIRDDEDSFAFNLGYLNVNRAEIQQNLEILDRVATSKGTEALRSAATGEVIMVNYKNLFTNPPKDLKAFLPTKFDARATIERSVKVGNKDKKISYRNYSEGTPTGWNAAAYEPYFPGVTKSGDVYKIARVLAASGGNWLFLQ